MRKIPAALCCTYSPPPRSAALLGKNSVFKLALYPRQKQAAAKIARLVFRKKPHGKRQPHLFRRLHEYLRPIPQGSVLADTARSSFRLLFITRMPPPVIFARLPPALPDTEFPEISVSCSRGIFVRINTAAQVKHTALQHTNAAEVGLISTDGAADILKEWCQPILPQHRLHSCTPSRRRY